MPGSVLAEAATQFFAGHPLTGKGLYGATRSLFRRNRRNVLGVVLVRTNRDRVGRDLSDVRVGEVSMIDMVGAELRRSARKVVLIGPYREGWESWQETVDGPGPLAGIATALERSPKGRVLVVGANQPFVRRRTLRALADIEHHGPVVPADRDGVRHYTCAVYPKIMANFVRSQALKGGTMDFVAEQSSVRWVLPDEWEKWGEDGRSWFQVVDTSTLDSGRTTFAG